MSGSGSGTRPPIEALTPHNRGPLVIVFASISACISVAFLAVRVFVAVKRKLAFQADDALIFAALATAIVQSVTWGQAAGHGLGRHASALSDADLASFFKYAYASQIVAILSMALSKGSVALLIRRLSIYQSSYTHSSIPTVVTAVCAIVSLFAVAFQCHLPNPWLASPDHCPARQPLWSAVIVLSIVSDALLALHVLPGVWRLSVAKSTRLTVAGLFALRLIVCIPSSFQLARLSEFTRSTDQPRFTVNFAIILIITTHLSLHLATIPRIHSFLSSLHAGGIHASVSDPAFRPGYVSRFASYVSGKSRANETSRSESTKRTDWSDGDGISDRYSLMLVPSAGGTVSTRVHTSGGETLATRATTLREDLESAHGEGVGQGKNSITLKRETTINVNKRENG